MMDTQLTLDANDLAERNQVLQRQLRRSVQLNRTLRQHLGHYLAAEVRQQVDSELEAIKRLEE